MGRPVVRCLVLAGTLVATGVAATGPVHAASTVGGGANNVVRVATTAGHTLQQRGSLLVTPFLGPYANSTNAALASATDCTGCRSVAVAFQVVLVGSEPQVFTPGNAAVATTGGCTGCVSFAFAFQYLVGTSGPAHLTPAGRAAVEAVADRVAEVVASGAAPATMCTELAGLAQQLVDAVAAPGNLDAAVQVERRSIDAPPCVAA
jgi:putative peptide zinc metalloprotease protein